MHFIEICMCLQSPCEECTGSTIFECTTCSLGYYFDSIGLTKCVKCTDNCTKCSSAVDEDTKTTKTTCTLCANGYKIDATSTSSTLGQCIPCTTNQYSVNNVCTSCNSACSTCTGPTSSDCKSCPAGQYLQPTGLNGVGVGICIDCALGCNSCRSQSQTDCISCSSGYYLFASICYIDACPYGLTADSSNVCNCVIVRIRRRWNLMNNQNMSLIYVNLFLFILLFRVDALLARWMLSIRRYTAIPARVRVSILTMEYVRTLVLLRSSRINSRIDASMHAWLPSIWVSICRSVHRCATIISW